MALGLGLGLVTGWVKVRSEGKDAGEGYIEGILVTKNKKIKKIKPLTH